tara:strand:+ start:1069 stop:1392 length:324 start_codon:yes stop_codon:yes gene_type:complete
MATMVKFVKAADAALTINPANFNGAVISAAGRMELDFTKTNGAATGTSLVDLNITDGAAGVEQKRVFQAIANALGGHPRHGAVVEVADVLTGKFIHKDITGIQAVTV